jgi:hypothetical protein
MNEDDRYLAAAQQIRDDPELPDELAPKLQRRLAAVATAEGDARTQAIDDLVVMLRDDPWTDARLSELVPDVERGVSDWLYGVLPGEELGTSDLLEFTCAACGYSNWLPYRPAEDDVPPCQNPDVDSHELVLD